MKKLVLFFIVCSTSAWVQAQKKWTLQECVEYALEHNLQVIQNEISKKNQDINLKIAKRSYLPTVGANFSNNANFGQNVSSTGLINRTDNYNNSLGVSANVLIYNNGRLEKQVRKANYDVEASQYDVETIKNDISLQIAQQYLSVLLNKEIEKISRSAQENAQKQYDRAKITTDVGTTAQTVLAEAASALAREKQNVKTAEINTGRNLFALAQLLQLPNYEDFDVVDVPVYDDMLTSSLQSVNDVLEYAYSNQPQLKAAESRIKAAEAQTTVTKTAFWPTVTASAGVGTSYYNVLKKQYVTVQDENGNPYQVAYDDPQLFKQYKDNFSQQLGLSANIPIFNQGITKLQVEQSKLNEELSKNSLEQQKQSVRQNVQKAKFDADANYEIYLASVEAEKSTKLSLDFAEKSYAAGRTTIFDLNVARNNYANAQGSVAQAKYNYLFSVKLLNFYAGIPISL